MPKVARLTTPMHNLANSPWYDRTLLPVFSALPPLRSAPACGLADLRYRFGGKAEHRHDGATRVASPLRHSNGAVRAQRVRADVEDPSQRNADPRAQARRSDRTQVSADHSALRSITASPRLAMKAVLQRVKGACVHVDGKLVSSIGPGIVALIGIGSDDTADDIVPLCSKMLSLKVSRGEGSDDCVFFAHLASRHPASYGTKARRPLPFRRLHNTSSTKREEARVRLELLLLRMLPPPPPPPPLRPRPAQKRSGAGNPGARPSSKSAARSSACRNSPSTRGQSRVPNRTSTRAWAARMRRRSTMPSCSA